MIPAADLAPDWVDVNARRYPSDPALEDGETGECRSWSQLNDRVARVAGMLNGRCGVGPGDRVCVIAEGDPRIFEVQFACMRLGAIMVPLNWRLSIPELVAMAQDAEPLLMLHDLQWAGVAEAVAQQSGIACTVAWRSPGSRPDFDELVDQSEPLRPDHARRLSDPSHILHTSGTTGAPKGAITTTGTMMWQTFNTAQDALLVGPGCRQLNPLPLFHAGGLTTLAAPMLLTGGCVTTLRRFDPEQVAGILGDPDRGVTHLALPPIMYQTVAETSGFGKMDLSRLRFAQVAGGVPALSLLETFADRGVVLQQAYGGTELGPAVTTMPRDSVAQRPTSCGRTVPFTQVRLLREDGSEAAPDEVGEVTIKGPSVTPGYWRRGSHSVDGWFRTGDAAYADADGFYFLVDRVKDMYKSGGENVYPAEVERVLATHPDVAELAIVGVPDQRWGEVGVAFVVLRSRDSMTLEDLTRHGDGQLARYKLPKALVLHDGALPRNTTGKVQKQTLKAGLTAR